MNIQSLLQLLVSNTLIYAAPLIFTALGGTFSERAGVVNIGLEGIMVMGAFSAAIFNLAFASQFGTMTPWIGLLVGGVIGESSHCYMLFQLFISELIILSQEPF